MLYCNRIVATIKLRVIDAKPFIKLTLERCNSFAACEARARELCERADGPFYFEALAFSRHHTALIYGDTCSAVPPDEAIYDPWRRWWLPFFHHHVEALTGDAESGSKQTLYMPLRDYLHRYYRGLFWEVELMLPIATQFWFRILFGWLLPPAVKHLKMLQTEDLFEQLNKDHIVQDVLVPGEIPFNNSTFNINNMIVD